MGNLLNVILPLLSNPAFQKLLPIIVQMGSQLFPAVSNEHLGSAVATALNPEQVKWIQAFLNWRSEVLEVDGVYGEATKDAVAKYQTEKYLIIDGWAGPTTSDSMRMELLRSIK